MGISVLETSKEKGQYGNAGTAYQLAQVLKSLNTSADNALRIAKKRGATSKDADGRLLIDVDLAIRGGPRRADQPTQE
jgi:predicted metal-dependent HD superfamily phosphohydrolase